jgi:hypothetical protein
MFTVFGSRYIVSTVACEISVLNRSCVMNLTRSAMPSLCAASFESLHQLVLDLDAEAARAEHLGGSKDDAAVAGAQVDDEVLCRSTSASLSMSVTTLCGDGT